MAMVPPARSFINLLAEKQRRYAVLFTGNTRVSLSLRVFGGGSQKAAFRRGYTPGLCVARGKNVRKKS